jgi:UDP-2-acetamido-3-amino-2,3-dideoxy-glucuronate N-acetyltransferase
MPVNCTLGRNAKIFYPDLVNIYGGETTVIGDETTVGPFVEIQKGVTIGKSCKIQSHAFICEGVTVEDGVFIGHGVMFINDRFPRATTGDLTRKTEADWKLEPTLIQRGAALGSNCTILCGIKVGEDAVIGAGSVVTKDVPAGAIVAGNPAKVIRKINSRLDL